VPTDFLVPTTFSPQSGSHLFNGEPSYDDQLFPKEPYNSQFPGTDHFCLGACPSCTRHKLLYSRGRGADLFLGGFSIRILIFSTPTFSSLAWTRVGLFFFSRLNHFFFPAKPGVLLGNCNCDPFPLLPAFFFYRGIFWALVPLVDGPPLIGTRSPSPSYTSPFSPSLKKTFTPAGSKRANGCSFIDTTVFL